MRLRFMMTLLILLVPAQSAAQEVLVPVPAKESRFESIVKLYDMNEMALAYHRHCVTRNALPTPKFMNNTKVITAALSGELRKQFPDKTQEEIDQEIFRRSDAIQKRMDRHFLKIGCQSEGLQKARKHYSIFGRMDEETVTSFISKF